MTHGRTTSLKTGIRIPDCNVSFRSGGVGWCMCLLDTESGVNVHCVRTCLRKIRDIGNAITTNSILADSSYITAISGPSSVVVLESVEHRLEIETYAKERHTSPWLTQTRIGVHSRASEPENEDDEVLSEHTRWIWATSRRASEWLTGRIGEYGLAALSQDGFPTSSRLAA
ncbi:hypothetical protein FA15DRAFT_742197 [Coprinopsis marcescibilis]|uniref:Uncharacterized protein n=1 Tax=Coprinopsis marcescibilis TaxID=230819 RepID=A0A5C3L8X3_COPMA|nr:hypothetical protein FA15DRAFT_742197 [Coprinopsis marcescibilis]